MNMNKQTNNATSQKKKLECCFSQREKQIPNHAPPQQRAVVMRQQCTFAEAQTIR